MYECVWKSRRAARGRRAQELLSKWRVDEVEDRAGVSSSAQHEANEARCGCVAWS
jgi:hypothetical protein